MNSILGTSLFATAAALVGFACPSAFSADKPSRGSAGENRTVVVLGDSLAAGNGVEPDEAFPAVLQEFVDKRGWQVRVVNAGVSGDTSAGGLRRIDWLLRQKMDVLILELGANDGLRGIAPPTTKSNLQAIIDRTRSKYPEVRIVIAGMRMPPNMGADYQRQFEQTFVELARENNAALIPFLLEGVGGRAEMNQGDRIHPTAAGQRILAENVWKVLEPVLREVASPSPG